MTVLVAGTCGGVIGGAIPTAAYRLSVAWRTPPRQSCDSCGDQLPAGVRGWLRWGSRCPACGRRNGPHPALMSAGCAVAFAGFAARFGCTPQLVPFLAILPLGFLLAAIDMACYRLPEALVFPAIGGSACCFAGLAAATGQWPSLGSSLLGALAFGAGYLLLAVLPGGQLGLGDVTLAVLLGLYLGWLGWPFVLLGAVLPFVVNAPVALWVLIVSPAGRGSELAFGPAMLGGGYLAVIGPPALATLLAR
ncbi:MAG: A24 family peptidase [Dactylosporangium sp.]|nr:A24 family peptidase [Dactylosporangium sp.]